MLILLCTHIYYIFNSTLHSLRSLYECCTIFLLFVLAEDNFDAIAWRMGPFVAHDFCAEKSKKKLMKIVYLNLNIINLKNVRSKAFLKTQVY